MGGCIVRIAVGVFLLPRPGGPDDLIEGRMGGFPAKGFFEFVLAGDQNSGITGPSRPEFGRDFAAGDAFGDSDHFEDRKTAAVADIVSFAGYAVDGLERPE